MELDLSGLSPVDRAAVEQKIKKYSVERESGCIEWVGGTYRTGYGTVWVSGKMRSAHRVVLALDVGIIPVGLDVMHSCDNRLCINLAHLSTGTKKDNMQDCKAKGRQANTKGEKNGRCKLTEFDVQRIRVSTLSVADLAEVHGVSEWSIYSIKNRRSWKHVP